jgi:effector-binding domain-containing protein
MPKMNFSRLIWVDASEEKVWERIIDFQHWTLWSPWTILEPDAKVVISEDGKYYHWIGKLLGEGNMKIVDYIENKRVDIDLNFVKPWKSYARVILHLRPKNGGCEVEWEMQSSLPFFLFFMKKMMIAYLGLDFDRGLRMLKELVEIGKVNSVLEDQGVHSLSPIKYIGVDSVCKLSEIGSDTASKFEIIKKFIREHSIEVGSEALNIYFKTDMVNDRMNYRVAIVVPNLPPNLPSPIVGGELKGINVYTIKHTGKYEHLGNAWSRHSSLERNKVYKRVKNIEGIEFYVNSPMNTAPEDLITLVHVPTKQ